ncbi:MAG: tyrosine-type recombinase/integrase [Symploca sp. SIO2G7]|nr:tyrosine-type recombinase/integrase [Symploca sp. SIO2G7]
MSLPLATVATEFLDRPNLASETVRSYESALMPLLKEYGSWPIELVDRDCLETYLNGLAHLAYTTHRRHQTILKALFNFALEREYLRSNPITRLKYRKPDPNKGEHASDQTIRYLTPDQLIILYQVVSHDRRLETLVRLLHRTGARISEILALNLTDLDLENRRFQVIGKGNKQRWCFYSEDVTPSLQAYLKYYRHSAHPALFTAQQRLTKQVTRLSYRTAYEGWKTLIGEHPVLEGIRIHDLRHTFATERVGIMGIEELRALMGHQNIQTTLRYQKVTSQRAEMAAQNAFLKLLNLETEDSI